LSWVRAPSATPNSKSPCKSRTFFFGELIGVALGLAPGVALQSVRKLQHGTCTMRNTYQNRHGTFYIRLKVPKVLLPHVSRPAVIQSLRTKEHRQAYLRSMKISMAFEQWAIDMKKNLGIGDDFRELVVTLPNGVKIDFDLQKQLEKEAYESLMGQFDTPNLPEQAPQSWTPTPLPSVPDWAKRTRLIDIFDSYKAAKAKTFAPATQDGYFPRVQKFIDFYDAKGVIYLDEIRKPHASDYREEVIRLQESPLTVDNYTKTLKGFFDFAIGAGKYTFENPFSNMHLVKKSERAKHTDSWIPYTKDEIQRLFVENFDVYCKRFNKPDQFFAPLISLTTGMRVDEIAQLYVSDVYQVNGIWVFDVNDNGEDKEVKTSSSIRKMPMPASLLQTNFLEYFQLVRGKYGENSLLFPYLTKTASNGYAKNISYNWTQYKQKLITVDESQKVFHSLRKNVGAAMVDNLVDLVLRKRILGHSMDGDITHTVYGKEFALENLRDILEKIQWGIDFSKFQFKFKSVKVLDGWVNAKAIKARKKAMKVAMAKKLESRAGR
jgi:integrase